MRLLKSNAKKQNLGWFSFISKKQGVHVHPWHPPWLSIDKSLVKLGTNSIKISALKSLDEIDEVTLASTTAYYYVNFTLMLLKG